MYRLQGYLASQWDSIRRVALARQDGQATVEYIGLTVVMGAGIGLIATKLDQLNFVTSIGGQLVKGITKGIGKIFGG